MLDVLSGITIALTAAILVAAFIVASFFVLLVVVGIVNYLIGGIEHLNNLVQDWRAK